MPPQHGLRLDDEQGLPPRAEATGQQYQQRPASRGATDGPGIETVKEDSQMFYTSRLTFVALNPQPLPPRYLSSGIIVVGGR